MDIPNKQTKAKMNQFIRLLISMNDIKEVFDISGILQEENEIEIDQKNRREFKIHQIKGEALSDALTIAYARPFSGNDKNNNNSIPDLTSNVLKNLTPEERKLHSFLLDHRNKAVAHSDSDLIKMEPFYLKVEKHKISLPVPLRNKTKFAFSTEMLREIKKLCAKLMGEIKKRQNNLEKDLIDYIPVKESGKGLDQFPFS